MKKEYIIPTLAISVIFYASGAIGQIANHILSYDNTLYNQKTKMVERIKELNELVPMMKEPFASEYKDNLQSLVNDTTEINLEIKKLEQKLSNIHNKEFYSWFGLFMD